MSVVAPSLRLARLNIITTSNARFLARQRSFLATSLSAARVAIAQLQLIEQALSQSLTEFDLNISASNERQNRSQEAAAHRGKRK